MTSPRYARIFIAIAAVLALFAGACGDDDATVAPAPAADSADDSQPAADDGTTSEPAETPAAGTEDATAPEDAGISEAASEVAEPAVDTAEAAEPEIIEAEPPVVIERLRLAGGDFGYPSPFGWVRGPGLIQAGFIFDTLAWQDATGDFIPWLASGWTASDDATEWRFTLRDNATWHDGEPVTAHDVAFTYQYVTAGAGAGAGGFAVAGLRQVADVVAASDAEVVFHLHRPSAAFLEDVAASVLIVPEHIWSSIDNPREERGPQATIGSGPYLLESADPGNGSYLYTANENFYLGAPVVKRLEFVPVNDELLAVQTGEVSAGEIGTEQPIPAEQMAAFEANENLAMVQSPGNWNLALHFNLTAGFPYDDVRFRRAVAHTVDRVDLVERILFGRGEPASLGGLSPTHAYGAEGLPTYPHDLAEANRLLDEIGLVDADGDGDRDMPDGSPFEPVLKASQRFSSDTPQLVREYLLAIGIDAEVVILDRASADEAGRTGDYTIQLHGYGGLAGDPDALRQRFADQKNSSSFNKAWGFSDARFDELASQQLVTLDFDARKAMVVEMQQIVAEAVPVLPIYVPDRVLFYDVNTFTNWYYTPGCSPCRGSRNKHMYVTGKKTGF